jgi:hypothetical protein
MASNLFTPGHISEVGNPGSAALPTNPFEDGRAYSFVSEQKGGKDPNLSPKNAGENSGEKQPSSGVNPRWGSFESTDDEDDSSSVPALASSTENVLDEIIEVSTSIREAIRSGGFPENNAQWTSHLAKNFAEGARRAKSPPGTPQSHELDDERALLRAVGVPG